MPGETVGAVRRAAAPARPRPRRRWRPPRPAWGRTAGRRRRCYADAFDRWMASGAADLDDRIARGRWPTSGLDAGASTR